MKLLNPKSFAKNEINVTPLVDVVLVLLIIFMVVAPLLQQGKQVSLPLANKNASAPTPEAQLSPLVISLTQDKTVFIGDKPVSKTALPEEVQQQLKSADRKKILLKGDRTLPFEEVRSVLEVLQQAGFRHIALAVEERKGS